MPRRKKKLIREWPVLYCSTMEEVEAAVKDKTFVFPVIRKGIRQMLDEGRTTYVCMEILCIDTITSIWISVDVEDCQNSLDLMLDWYTTREEYEECSDVVSLKAAVSAFMLVNSVDGRLKKAEAFPQDPNTLPGKSSGPKTR